MTKEDFLKEILSISREQIQDKLNEKCPRVKKVWPVAVLKPPTENTIYYSIPGPENNFGMNLPLYGTFL